MPSIGFAFDGALAADIAAAAAAAVPVALADPAAAVHVALADPAAAVLAANTFAAAAVDDDETCWVKMTFHQHHW